MAAEHLTITLEPGHPVSGLSQVPGGALGCLVLAHGAGAGMTHPFMTAVAEGLFSRNIATLRYQFPYMEAGSKRPDRPALAHATVRAAVAAVQQRCPGLRMFAGGKSFGGRMTSQAQASRPLPGVQGLVFLGFPLHPAKQPSDERARHLADIDVPMLFVQGSRDAMADTDLLLPLAQRLGNRATLRLVEHADHSFHVPARSGRTNRDALEELLDAVARWMGSPPAGKAGNAIHCADQH